jgi:NAD-dependent dihydropyrimidine dehydrogenase PreA subunit
VTKQDITIYCHCTYYQLTPDSVKEKVLNTLKNSGTEFEAVADLCRMCAKGDPELQRWAQHKSIRIIACYPRTVKWLFYAAGVPLPETGVEFLNMRSDSTEKIVSSLTSTSAGKQTGNIQLEKTGNWVPWFPVIDYDRCTSCKQCLNFCLFGVYELSEQNRVEVRNPANCKTNCPACARACPNSAIIFPKYSDSPINGDEVREQIQQAQEMKLDMSKLSDVNVYDAIRRRSKSTKRFSRKTEQQAGTGQGASFLKELQEKLDIPPDVLASLSPVEMANIKANIDKQDSTVRRPRREASPSGKAKGNTQQSTSSESEEEKKRDE